MLMAVTCRRLHHRADKGSVVLEFALTAPILISLLLGMFDIGPTLMVRFKVGAAAQTVADLVTLSSTIQVADIGNFFGAGSDVMAPFSATPLSLRITNIASDGQGRAFVYWSCGQGTLTPYTATSTVSSTPTGTSLATLLLLSTGTVSGGYKLSGTNTSFIMVEATYNYVSPSQTVFTGTQTMSTVAYAMPRVSTYVGPSTGGTYTPPTPTAIKSNYTAAVSGVSCSVGY